MIIGLNNIMQNQFKSTLISPSFSAIYVCFLKFPICFWPNVGVLKSDIDGFVQVYMNFDAF